QLGLDTQISEVMSTNPKSVNPDVRASDALTLMNEQKINQLLIINDDKTLAGILTLHELLHAGVN
ncbi:CBS domain-containing protein, partial [Xanthomonas citri pv. citri]